MTTSPTNTTPLSLPELTPIKAQHKHSLETTPLSDIDNFSLFHSLYIYLPTELAEEFYKRFFPQNYHQGLELCIWPETQESLDAYSISSIESDCAINSESTTEETNKEA